MPAFPADLHEVDAGVVLPFAFERGDEVPAIGQLHPVPVAVQQILVAALIDADDGDRGAVRSLPFTLARVHQDRH